MRRKNIALVVICLLVVIIVSSYLSAEELDDFVDTTSTKKAAVFHVTLADPNLYVNGIFNSSFEVYRDMPTTTTTTTKDSGQIREEGQFTFDFVPNGSSPKILSITLSGDNFDYSEDFVLKGTKHEAGLGEFYTWEYLGQDTIFISEDNTTIDIAIDPNDNTQGSVSVYIYP